MTKGRPLRSVGVGGNGKRVRNERTSAQGERFAHESIRGDGMGTHEGTQQVAFNERRCSAFGPSGLKSENTTPPEKKGTDAGTVWTAA